MVFWQYFGSLQVKIEQFERTAVWINKEEELLKKTISTFPELEEIKVISYYEKNTECLYFKPPKTYIKRLLYCSIYVHDSP